MTPPPAALDRLHDPAPHARLLSNGRYTVLVTGAGSGYSVCDGLALTAWDGDRIADGDGLFVYVRDVERGTLWSVGHQPVQRPAERYAARARPGVVEITREDDGIESSVEMCVAADADVELRRIRLRNRTEQPRRLEVTTYAAVVLNDPAAHAAHPAFSKLFVETEWVAEAGALLARRRPRSRSDPAMWMVHALAGTGPLQYETDRARFLGRGRTAADPVGMSRPLSGTVGSVLDPCFCLRRTLQLAAGARAELTVLLGVAGTRAAALTLADLQRVDSQFAQAVERERARRRALELEDERAELLQDLAGAMLYGSPDVRAVGSCPPGRVDVSRYGLSGTKPLVAVLADGDDGAALARQLVAARAYWRALGLDVELLILTDDPAALHEQAPSGVAVRRRADVPSDELGRVQLVARAVISGGLPVPGGRDRCPPPGAPRWHPAAGDAAVPAAVDEGERLQFDNGYGGFTPDGTEYVIRVGGSAGRPPMPWVNVIANDSFGFLVSEAGAGCTWSRNSREHRLTPWYNDPVADPHGEALYVRDEDAGVFWSPLPGPAPAPAVYEARHGFGYSTWRHTSHEVVQEVCLFVPPEDPVKVIRLRLTNESARARRLSVFSYARLVLGGLPSESGRAVVTALDADTGAILAHNPLGGDFADGVVFAAALPPPGAGPARVTGDRAAFLGRNGTVARPAALAGLAEFDGSTGAGLDPCAALQLQLEVAPGATVECAFLLGETIGPAAARALVARYREPGAVSRAFEDAGAAWRATLGAVQVETPVPALDVLVNGWLGYQNQSCRLWGRTAFYQSGGAFGFRDQLQDAAALVYVRPDRTRAQILLHAAHQFVEGDVLHWWHPPAGRGTRTRFSDDLVWLPYVTAFYVRTTGDASVLDEPVGFVTARPLAPGEDEAYLPATPAAETADLYAHCCRALDRSLTRGAHGLPLMGTGDWNDGMNRVGREGRGESVWLGFFLYFVLGEFVALCEQRNDGERMQRYGAYRVHLQQALEEAGWDGAWYRRAYYDDGTPLGSALGDECRIDALAQAWAVISGAAPRERTARALDAVERELVVDDPGLVRLLAPPFDRTAHDPGYIKGYVPGIRENGGQYTHAALWVVRALAELGRRDRAAALLERIGPVHHGRSLAAVGVYQVEPYVVAADIYGVAPHLGRGGWTWYTGSAGWMYRVALESVLGVTLEGGRVLRLKPCIPDAWPGFAVRLRLGGQRTCYDVEVRNPGGHAATVTAVDVDGQPGGVEDGAARVTLIADGVLRRITVTLGAA